MSRYFFRFISLCVCVFLCGGDLLREVPGGVCVGHMCLCEFMSFHIPTIYYIVFSFTSRHINFHPDTLAF